MQRLYIGSEYNVVATLDFNKKYKSWQYKPKVVSAIIPDSEEQEKLFLQSLLTPNQTKVLLQEYPNIVNDVINGKDNVNVSKLKGIGEITWKNIKDKILNNYIISDILVLLQPLGVTFNTIKKLLNYESNPTLLKQKLIENPYIMTDVSGLGFKKVDALAIKINPEIRLSKQRVYAFIKYYFTELGEQEGHTWVLQSQLNMKINTELYECINIYNEIINFEKEHGDFLYFQDDKVGLKKYHDIEENTYKILLGLDKCKRTWNFHIKEGIEEAEKQQGFKYTDEQINAIKNALKSNVAIISGKAGCVDCDTEFFNGMQWKKISKYQEGDKVLQYNKDGSAELVEPLNYIKQTSDFLWHFETKYGLDQCLSDNHNCYYITSKGNLYSKKFKEIREVQQNNNTGFSGKFITTFKYNGVGIPYSDNEIRLFVAIIADGTFNYQAKRNWDSYNRCYFNLKKTRKIERLKILLDKLNIKYVSKCNKKTGYTRIRFDNKFRIKQFPKSWYNCSQEQLQIICNELIYWDGDFKCTKNRISTTVKENADFIQWCYTAIGIRSTININDRRNRTRNINGKEYKIKLIDYDVCFSKRILISMCSDSRLDHKKTLIEQYPTKDGYEYCFTVPSHMLVLRRNNKIFITGNCGKTSIARGLLNVYKISGYSIAATAFSAKAAQRITEATGFPASTMHRLLGAQGISSFQYNAENPLYYDTIFLDEGSMVNALIFYDLVKAIKQGSRLIICGDNRQLPPIGYGNIFDDLLKKKEQFNINQLMHIHRQAEKSGILSDANKIREGQFPIEEPQLKIVSGELQDMTYMFRDDPAALQNIAIKTYLKSVEEDGLDNVVLITPRKKNCPNSSNELNKILQDKIITDDDVPFLNYGSTQYKLGAKVIQRQNNYEKNVFNGEIGYITAIYKDHERNMDCFNVEYKMNDTVKKIEYTRNELNQIELAYALTVHVSQGSGYKTVIIIIDNSHYIMLDSCLLYTAITRAKKRCLLLAEPLAFKKCINTNKTINRQTWLELM